MGRWEGRRVVWGRKRHRPQTSPLNGCVLLYTAAYSCPTAGLHLQPQQAWLPHLSHLRKAIACAPTCTKSTQIAFGFVEKGQNVWELCSCCIRQLLVVLFTMTVTYCCPVILTSESSPRVSAGVFVRRLGNTIQLLTDWDGHLQLCSCKGQRVRRLT